jgi:hypothetical protein
MVFVSLTRLRFESIFDIPQFVLYAVRSQRQSEHAPGLIRATFYARRETHSGRLRCGKTAAAMEGFPCSRRAHGGYAEAARLVR